MNPTPMAAEIAELATWTNSRVNQDPSGAMAVANRVLSSSTVHGHLAIEADALRIRGSAAFQMDRMPQAHADGTRAARLSRLAHDTRGWLKARNLMATSSLMMGDSAAAEVILREGLPEAREFGDEQLISHYLGNLAGIALAQAKVFEAIELLGELQEIAERNGWVDDWLSVANNLASSYLGLRDAESAARICRLALTRYDTHPDMHLNRAYLLHSLACALEQMGDIGTALTHHEQAVDHALDYGDIGLASTALLDAARLSRQAGEVNRARDHYQHLLTLRIDHEADAIDSTEFHALATWGLEAIDGAFTRETADRLQRLIDRGVPADREQRRAVFDALAEALVGLGELPSAVDLLQQSLKFRDNLWAETLQLHAYSSAQAIQIREARRQADEERWRREELVTTFSQVEQLNAENETLVQQLRDQAALLEQLSREDSLTGLLNRRAFDEQHAAILAGGATTGLPVTTGFIDVDDFKRINDEYSHAVGDKVLETVSRIIGEHVREGDAVGRYGGEEFVLALPRTATDEAREFGDRILQAVNRHDWNAIAPDLVVTLCIGLWTSTGATSPAESLDQADHLVYAAKRAGKNQLRVSST